jgi:hypothetical protein
MEALERALLFADELCDRCDAAGPHNVYQIECRWPLRYASLQKKPG